MDRGRGCRGARPVQAGSSGCALAGPAGSSRSGTRSSFGCGRRSGVRVWAWRSVPKSSGRSSLTSISRRAAACHSGDPPTTMPSQVPSTWNSRKASRSTSPASSCLRSSSIRAFNAARLAGFAIGMTRKSSGSSRPFFDVRDIMVFRSHRSYTAARRDADQAGSLPPKHGEENVKARERCPAVCPDRLCGGLFWHAAPRRSHRMSDPPGDLRVSGLPHAKCWQLMRLRRAFRALRHSWKRARTLTQGGRLVRCHPSATP